MLKYDWEITGKIDTNEAMRIIFHPTLYQFYLKNKIKDLKNLRIEVVDGKHGSIIKFSEEKQ